MYTLYEFHFLNGITEINQLFDDILIIWPAPVYTTKLSDFNDNYNLHMIYIIIIWFILLLLHYTQAILV